MPPLTTQPNPNTRLFSIPLLVAALGYFVDVYDLLLFSIIRKPSLESLGLNAEQVLTQGEHIISLQMIGLLIGGVLWGVIGDKKGRLSVLFGSILLYSLANIANGFVQTVEQYAWIRFVAGIGLAGELGAGITLVSEIAPKEKRGIATSLVAGIGLSGAVLAYFCKEFFESWRTCYFIGGGLGLALLFLRIQVFESALYKKMQHTNVAKGNVFQLFNTPKRLKKYLLSVAIGLPTWYVIGVLVTFSAEFAERFGIIGKVDSGRAVMFAYLAIAIGDIAIGFVSQSLRSRRKALFVFYGITILFIGLFFSQLYGGTAGQLYAVCAGLGFGTGFWAIFVTMGAEQYGTNIRATAATTIPNMVRGLLSVFILPLFQLLRGANKEHFVQGAIITGVIVMAISCTAAYLIEETFGKDMNFIEE
jgi:MFS transporter, putative metabolite:H+ symporter